MMLPLLRSGTAAIALLFSCAAAAQFAPAPQFVPAPTPTADALAAQMRQLGSNPRDVYALIAAGELSTKLGDPAAALGFFSRAAAIEPTNPRVAAGKAGALVLLERPGEALQLYAQAERAGLAMDAYLAQRGLAYDLIGQPGYAQRDYRRALLLDRDDESVRRLALSLGISGRRDEAMALLEPLLRRSDRAAWRARACILAISGDVAGAQRIAASMMTGGAALSPFFSRLQWLSPADRAFAVHFGEVGGTAARISDARLAPALAPLPVEPQVLPSPAPVIVADVRSRAPADRRRRRRSSRDPVAVAAAAVPAPAPALPASPRQPVQVATRGPLPPAVLDNTALPGRAPAPSAIPMQTSTATPVSGTASAATAASASSVERATPWAVTADAPRATSTPRAGSPPVEVVTLPQRPSLPSVAAPPPPPRVEPAGPAAQPAPSLDPGAAGSTVPPTPPSIVPVADASSASSPVVSTPAPPTAVTAGPPAKPRTPEVARRNTAMLASIVETIAVPASELGVTPLPHPAPRKSPEPKPTAPAAEVKGDTVRTSRLPTPRKADAKSGDTKTPDAKKSDANKPESKKPDPTKLEPARWWVQVAGGANAADLGKDWRRLSAKSPAAFKGKTAWMTPLRATNRLLAGPFKSQVDAMAFVNALAKDGTSAFAWQSDAGQPVERLATK